MAPVPEFGRKQPPLFLSNAAPHRGCAAVHRVVFFHHGALTSPYALLPSADLLAGNPVTSSRENHGIGTG
jgi:hypothetical protein